MEDPRIISALFIFLKMAYYNVLINNLYTNNPSDPASSSAVCISILSFATGEM